MKKILAAVTVFCLLTIPAGGAFATQYNTGCGLGSIVMENQDGLVFQVLAVTTNGTFANQTFGITFGTLNCDKPASFASLEQSEIFIANNMDSLANDIARGQGEYLDTLAVLMEIPENERGVFYAKLQENFSAIYSSSEVSSTEILSGIQAHM